MLGWGHIAEKISASSSSNGSTDGCSDVVIAGCNIRSQGSQQVERGSVTELFLHNHVGNHLIQRHMARPLDDYLHSARLSSAGQLAKEDEFLDLRPIGGIYHCSRPKAVPQAQGNVISVSDVQQRIEVLVEGILFVVLLHPVHEDGTATTYRGHKALVMFQTSDNFPGDPAVNGNVIETFGTLGLNTPEHGVGTHLG